MAVRDRPILTDIYPEVNEFLPEKGSAYVLGTSVEQRSTYSSGWEAKAVAKGVEFVRIVKQEATNIEVVIDGSSKLITNGASCFAGGFALFGSLMLRCQHEFSTQIAESGLPAPKSAACLA